MRLMPEDEKKNIIKEAIPEVSNAPSLSAETEA